MLSIGHEPEMVKGLEILTFDQAQLEKFSDSGNQT